MMMMMHPFKKKESFWRDVVSVFQVRGHSDSAYSLYDMQDLDPQYDCTWSDVSGLVTKMRDEWKVMSICDIVLNHAANNSDWVREHPECTYGSI